MDNEDKETLLARWLSGELTKEEQQDLESQEDLGQLKKIIDQVDQFELPKYDQKSAFAKIKAQKKSTETKEVAKIRRMPFLRYAAAAVILLLIGFFVFNPFSNSISSYDTLAGMQENIILPDGSEIILNNASHIDFNKKKWENNRVVNLKGEAFFNVKKGSTFKVVSNQGTVTVLGTSFNIYNRNNDYEVSCYTGRVKVETENNSEEITAGQKIKLVNHKMVLLPFSTNNSSWRKGVSNFESVSLDRVILELELQFGIDIKDEKINKKQTFTGTFLHNDLDTALKMVFSPMNIKYNIQGNEVMLTQ